MDQKNNSLHFNKSINTNKKKQRSTENSDLNSGAVNRVRNISSEDITLVNNPVSKRDKKLNKKQYTNSNNAPKFANKSVIKQNDVNNNHVSENAKLRELKRTGKNMGNVSKNDNQIIYSNENLRDIKQIRHERIDDNREDNEIILRDVAGNQNKEYAKSNFNNFGKNNQSQVINKHSNNGNRASNSQNVMLNSHDSKNLSHNVGLNQKRMFKKDSNISNPSTDFPDDNFNVNQYRGNLSSEGRSEIDQDVDRIISEIIPDYNNSVSIELNHVNLTFEVNEDKIDNLKELVIRTLKRNKSKSKKFKVLDDITFRIYAGEKVGIIGYNGAGKSTLLNVITGVYPPDSGDIMTHGKISPLLSLGAGFNYNYSGAKNIFLNAAVLGYDKEFVKEKFDEIVEFSELGEFINYPIKNYSSGMMAKLGFSIATIVNPDILIIDEILSVGDVKFQKKSNDKMKSLVGGKTTLILVSHSIPQIRELCDKAIWIDNGKIREMGEVNKVCDHYIKDSEKASREQLHNIRFI